MRWFVATLVTGGMAFAAAAEAQSPPAPPTFAYLYGRATVGGENIVPESQPLLAFVNGKSCGAMAANTFVAADGDGVPEEDVGSTVYVIDVLAGGDRNYERPGCGQTGDPITLYPPAMGRLPSVQPLFRAGPMRADLEFDVNLQFRAILPQLAPDSAR
jgi:hypothetical protein